MKRLLGTDEPAIFQTPSDQNKVYQNAVRCVDLDVERVALGAYLDTAVVKSAIKAIFQAIADTCLQCHDLVLAFDIAHIEVTSKRLKCTFGKEIAAKVQSEQFEKNVGVGHSDP